MYYIPIPPTEWVLLLTPVWSDWSLWARTALTLGLLLGPVALVLLCRNELRLVRRPAAVCLLTLRLLVLSLVMFVVLLQPVLLRDTTLELPGRVLVAVDRSESMDVADPQRLPVDKLRLALALKLATDLCPDAQLQAWIRDYQDKGAPIWIRPDEAEGDAARRAELAAQRQRLHDQVCTVVDEQTRGAMARRLLAPDGVQLLQRLTKRHQVDLLGFAKDSWDGSVEQLDELFHTPAAVGVLQATDLKVPLVRALERTGPDSAQILGVVLLTDGKHNVGESPVAKALELGQKQLPLFPVALGARQLPPDVVVVAVKAPAAVFKGSDIQVEAHLRVTGLPAQDVIVELHGPKGADSDALLDQLAVHHDGTDKSYVERFPVRLDEEGTKTLRVVVRPVLKEPKEIRTDNNSQTVKVNVANDKARVLLIDGEARWEFHYLASALARDRSMQVQSVVFQQPRANKVPEDDLVKSGNPSLTLPADPDALAGYDCIVLGDVLPEQLPAADRLRLEKYVADRGGTLVMLAGKHAMPLAYSQDAAAGDDPLIKLLPLEQPHLAQTDPEKGFAVTLTAEGGLAAFLQMEPDPAKSAERWGQLPHHFWGVVGKAKPGATSLACVTEDAGKPEDRSREQALIVRQNYGFGRVLFVGIDSTWRWRYKTGDTYHHRFWGQVIRWAATDKPLVTGNDWVRFGTREPVYQQGQEIDLIARLSEEMDPVELKEAKELAGAQIIRKTAEGTEQVVAVAPLTPREAQPRVLEGKVRDLPAGEYAVELLIPKLNERGRLQGTPGPDGQPGKLRAVFTVNPSAGAETADLSCNWPLLEDLAAKSGGRFFTADDAAELIDLLNSKSVLRTEHLENRLWQWWVTLAVLLALLTVEWVVRKGVGLP
jgi:hypothetical protein